MTTTRMEKQKRLRLLLEEVMDLEEDIYGEKSSYRRQSLEKNNQRWQWLEENARVLWTPEGEGILSAVVDLDIPKEHLTSKEAVRILVDRGITENLQPSDLEGTLEFNCPNLIVTSSGDLSCKFCKT